MGLPSVTFAKAIAVDGSSVKVERQTEAGYDEVVCPLPALVTVTAGVVEPRYPSFKGIMAAKSKPVDNLTVADLGIDAVAGRRGRRRAGDHRRLRGRGARRGRDRGGRGRRRAARRGLPRAAEGGLRCRSTRCGCWPKSGDSGPTPGHARAADRGPRGRLDGRGRGLGRRRGLAGRPARRVRRDHALRRRRPGRHAARRAGGRGAGRARSRAATRPTPS